MNYFKQILFELKHQKMMTWVSISGTAIAIFLMMAFIMSESVYDVESAPESKRGRILYGQNIHIKEGPDSESSGQGVSYEATAKFYENLDGVEIMCYLNADAGSSVDINVKNELTYSMIELPTDANIWKIYDYTFAYGRPFNAAEAESESQVAVVSRSAARELFNEENAVGRVIEISSKPFRIIGVIENPKPILQNSFADVILPFNPKNHHSDDWFGSCNALLLIKKGADIEDIKKQVEKRFSKVQSLLEKEDKELIYHGQPYTAKEIGLGVWTNAGPDIQSHNTFVFVSLSILILLPAINLSSMTRSRLRRRVSEIGVRRAFGASQRSIITRMFGENFIMTLIGGGIGLILSFIFMILFSNSFFVYGDFTSSEKIMYASPDFGMLFKWNIFLWALLLCFVLNLLSAFLPAWKASNVEPAEAIAASH